MGLSRWLGSSVALWLGACGPAVAVDVDGTSTSAPPRGSSTTGGVSAGGTSSGGSTVTGPASTTVIPPGTTSTSPGSGSGSDTEVGETGRDFIMEPDGLVSELFCGVWEDENQCLRGQDCSPFSNDGTPTWNASICTPLPDEPDFVGEPCVIEDSPVSGVDSCEAKSMCFGVDPKTLAGTCVAYCLGEAKNTSCADPSTTCVVGNDYVIAMCLPSCDPVLQDCANGEMCVGNYGEQTGFFCSPPGTPYVNLAGVQPAACTVGQVGVLPELIDDCMEGEPCCAQFCDLPQPEQCTPGLECTAWTAEGTCPGGCSEGVCLSPS